MRTLPLLLVLAACATRPPPEMDDAVLAVLDEPDKFVLYSLHPDRDQELSGKPEKLAGYPVLGKAELNATDRDRILVALWKAFGKRDGTDQTGFRPRYAIRADKGAKTVHFLVCFECSYANWYHAGKQAGGRATTGGDARAAFEEVLKAHDVPLAPK